MMLQVVLRPAGEPVRMKLITAIAVIDQWYVDAARDAVLQRKREYHRNYQRERYKGKINVHNRLQTQERHMAKLDLEMQEIRKMNELLINYDYPDQECY